MARLPRQGQREVTQPAKQVQHGVVRAGFQQFQGLRDHPAIEGRVDLYEIERLEAVLQAVFGQCIAKIRLRRRQRLHGIRAFRLQQDDQAG